VSLAAERCLGGDESRDPLQSSRKALLARIDRGRRGALRKLQSLRAGLSASAEADNVMQQGQLILAFSHAIVPGSPWVDIPDMDIRIALDPRQTASENAERMFARYRKLRDAQRRIPPLIEDTERHVQELTDLAGFVAIAASEGDLRDLERELAADGTRSPRASTRKRGPSRYILDGTVVLAGRTARENDEVTFRLARRDDLWLHARNRTGAHVILHADRGQPSEEVVLSAAGLAAYLSEGRSDSAVDVDVTQVRHVRKISGGPPGRVTYRNERTLRVRPDRDGWQTQR
jgi:predicted ribosome quality control (RQC) complex YloA/Tae2 family protein